MDGRVCVREGTCEMECLLVRYKPLQELLFLVRTPFSVVYVCVCVGVGGGVDDGHHLFASCLFRFGRGRGTSPPSPPSATATTLVLQVPRFVHAA